jgi:hypothetical protein
VGGSQNVGIRVKYSLLAFDREGENRNYEIMMEEDADMMQATLRRRCHEAGNQGY